MKQAKVWAIIGANEELGEATIKYLLSKHQVVITIGDTTASVPLYRTSAQPIHISIDHNNEALARKTLEAVVQQYGPIDILINNISYGFTGSLTKAAPGDMEGIVYYQIANILRMIRLVLPYMKASPLGQVISMPPKRNTDSLQNMPNNYELYSAIDIFSKYLRQALETLEIRVTFIAPAIN